MSVLPPQSRSDIVQRITQDIYTDSFPSPEIQFINALIEKKAGRVHPVKLHLLNLLQVVQLRQLDLGDLPKRDYTLYISLPCVQLCLLQSALTEYLVQAY